MNEIPLELAEDKVAWIRENAPFEMDLDGIPVLVSIEEDAEGALALRLSLVKKEGADD